jgi:hypothetical protein
MTISEPYSSAAAVEMAIKDAALRAHQLDPTVSVHERIRQAYFDRLLCRVFSDGEISDWVLKGGTGVLARVPNARATKDIDLFKRGYKLGEALVDLRRLAALDLGDHFRFEYLRHETSIAGDQQPYADGYRITFATYLGVKNLQPVRVDLVTGLGDIDAIEFLDPINRIDLPRLATCKYRLYPVVNQIADKVCATMSAYASGPSSREHDLVDLVVFATTQTIDADSLRRWILVEAQSRGLGDIRKFEIPKVWGSRYGRAVRDIPTCLEYASIADARGLMADFIDTVLENRALSGEWNPVTRQWIL